MCKFKRIVSVFTSFLIMVSILAIFPINSVTVFATQQRYNNFSKNYTLTGNGAADMLAVAFAQVGKSKTEFGYTEAWCADFVCDCAYLANQTYAIPLNGAVSHPYQNIDGERWYGLLELVLKAGGVKTTSPQPGDLVFWKNSAISHVEIVCRVDNGVTYSIGGNNTVKSASGNYNGCAGERRCTSINSDILCYVRPNYSGDPPPPQPEIKTPTITTNKNTYNYGDIVNISWTASPSGSNLSHYWLQIFSPDGSTLLNETMNMSTSYSFKPTQSGEYKIVAWATPSGSKEGEGSLTDTKTIYVNSSEPKFYMSDNRVDINMDNSTQHYVRFSYSDYDGPITISYEHGTRTFTQLEWGEWENNSIKLYVSGFQSGDEIITVKFKNSNTSEVLKTFTFIASMTGTLRASPEKQIYYLDLDNPQPVDVIFRVMSTPSSGYLHLESWSDENGYYYADDDVYAGGIKAIPSIYREGDAVYVKYTVTPKKIGKYPLNLMWEENDGTRWWIGQTEAIVKGDPKFSVNKNNIVLNLDKSETETIHFKYIKDFLWNHQNIQVKRNGEKIKNLKWGQWQDHEIDLTLSGYSPGKETITFELYDTETKEVLATQNVVVEVTGTTKLLVSDDNVKLNMDENEEFSVVFTAAVIPATTKTFNINVVRNGTKAANLKWGAWNSNIIELTLSGYSPGKETITFELYDTKTKEVLATQNVVVEVNGTTKLLVSDGNVKLNMDKNEECSVVFTSTSIPVTTKYFNINVVRNGTKATNLKWGAWNNNIIELTLSGYRPGKETITFELYDTETKEVLATQDVIVEVLGEIKGDCNADGEFSISDVVVLQKWLLADPSAKLNNWKAADLCEDDRLDVFDLCLMKRMLVENS